MEQLSRRLSAFLGREVTGTSTSVCFGPAIFISRKTSRSTFSGDDVLSGIRSSIFRGSRPVMESIVPMRQPVSRIWSLLTMTFH